MQIATVLQATNEAEFVATVAAIHLRAPLSLLVRDFALGAPMHIGYAFLCEPFLDRLLVAFESRVLSLLTLVAHVYVALGAYHSLHFAVQYLVTVVAWTKEKVLVLSDTKLVFEPLVFQPDLRGYNHLELFVADGLVATYHWTL